MIRQFYFSGVLIALFFDLLILSKPKKSLKDYLLAIYVFLLGTNLLIIYGMGAPDSSLYPIISILDIFYWVLLGPILLIYTQVLISGTRKLNWKSRSC